MQPARPSRHVQVVEDLHGIIDLARLVQQMRHTRGGGLSIIALQFFYVYDDSSLQYNLHHTTGGGIPGGLRGDATIHVHIYTRQSDDDHRGASGMSYNTI